MKPLLKKLLAPPRIEYVRLNQDLIILDSSFGAGRFADLPSEVRAGSDARAGFPELIGVEDILRAVLQGRRANFELKGIARFSDPSSPLYIDLYATADRDEETPDPKLVIFFEDVTEMMVLRQSLVQRANEASLLLSALASSKDYIDKIIHSMADPLIVTALSGHIKTVNPATQELFGHREEELIGQPLSMLVDDETFLRRSSQRLGFLSEGELLKDVEVVCHRKTGEKITVAFSCAAIQTEIKGLQDLVYIGRDISARKRAEAEIRKALEKEKELNELKSRFVSMTSHEFRNPLTTILTAAALLKEEYASHQILDDDTRMYFQMIQTSVRQMTDLLEDVLVIGKAEAGKLEFHPEPLDLAEFCRHLALEMEMAQKRSPSGTASAPAITFVCQEECIKACMDEKLLRQILANLLSNAVKYSPQGNPVRFEITSENGEATFEIQDRGIGIPTEDQKRLFETFYRAKNARKLPGTGLGLAIVKKAVELHGGRISVSSESGVGTTFRVTIPLDRGRQTKENDVIS
ncbi:sensor histidine kinase [Kamptonema formosum]|uniref:sensor histidine kinase n=1 Tax=Kamptonema formosum TaxID=331992 RepID=UPI0003462003|nr:ATP-binding protein [Oscillatoria sp. PCC 10802]